MARTVESRRDPWLKTLPVGRLECRICQILIEEFDEFGLGQRLELCEARFFHTTRVWRCKL